MSDDDFDIYGDLDDMDVTAAESTVENCTHEKLDRSLKEQSSRVNSDGIYSECISKEEYTNLGDLIIMEEKMESVIKENNLLKGSIQALQPVRKKLELENRILKANISSLYKTAKAEIDRKNSQISELRNELDDLILRRTRNVK